MARSKRTTAKAAQSEGALMAKSEGKKSFERDYLPPLWPVLYNTLREGFEGIGLPFRELKGESTEEIAARASADIQELAARVKQHCSAEKLTHNCILASVVNLACSESPRMYLAPRQGWW